MYLIIDVGNTRAKLAVFEKDTLLEVFVCDKQNILKEIDEIILKYVVSSAIISAVATLADEKIEELHQKLPFLIALNHQTKVPFINKYATPNTLGVDRIALASGAVKKFPDKNVLVIDAGTCITFDFINKKQQYLGGAISPGVRIRYKALHDYTAKLPLLKTIVPEGFIGNDTSSSIHSGVVNGVLQEIEGIIQQYKEKYEDLTIVLTGGDTIFLAKQLKSGIFASQNFLLEGLHAVLMFNIEKKSE